MRNTKTLSRHPAGRVFAWKKPVCGGARTGIARKLFFLTNHNANPYASETYEYIHFWNTIPWSPTFFPAARKECRPRKDRRPVIPP